MTRNVEIKAKLMTKLKISQDSLTDKPMWICCMKIQMSSILIIASNHQTGH